MSVTRKADIAALVAFLSLGAGTACLAEPSNNVDHRQLLLVEEHASPKGKGSDAACGKGSCGVDTKGAQAAKKSHAKKSSHKKTAKTNKSAKPATSSSAETGTKTESKTEEKSK